LNFHLEPLKISWKNDITFCCENQKTQFECKPWCQWTLGNFISPSSVSVPLFSAFITTSSVSFTQDCVLLSFHVLTTTTTKLFLIKDTKYIVMKAAGALLNSLGGFSVFL
jgi:hypothetical protein